MKDYSQWGEQAAILQFFEGRPPAAFLDIGAADGITESNTYALHELGWRGVYVEPDPDQFAKLRSISRPADTMVNVPIGPETEATWFHVCNSRRSSTIANLAFQHGHTHSFLTASLCLFDIAKICRDVVFASIDAEGLDNAFLKDFVYLPKLELICVEDAFPGLDRLQDYDMAQMDALHKIGFTKQIFTTSVEDGDKMRWGNTLWAKGN